MYTLMLQHFDLWLQLINYDNLITTNESLIHGCTQRYIYCQSTMIKIEKFQESCFMDLEYFWKEKCKGVRQQMKCPLSVPIEPCVFRINLQKKLFLFGSFRVHEFILLCVLTWWNKQLFHRTYCRDFHILEEFFLSLHWNFSTHMSHASMNNGAFQPHFLVSCLLLEVFVICKALTFNESF